MQSSYDERFEREMGCTAAELIERLPGAVDARPLQIAGASAEVTLDAGRLLLRWQTLPARRIALITLPRLRVQFAFEGIAADARHRFMRRFDLYMQRGGG